MDTKTLAFKADIDFEPKTRTFAAIATSPMVDLDDEVVIPEGLDPEYFKSKGTIYFNHDTNRIVGSLRNPPTMVRHGEGKAWRIQGVVAKTPLGSEVWELMRAGHVRGVSIGFQRLEWGAPTADEIKRYGQHRSIVRKARWLETSVTGIPANPDAMIESVAEVAAGLEKAVGAGVCSADTAEMVRKSLARFAVARPPRRVIFL